MATRKSELVITCNAKAVKDVFEYLNRQLADVKQKLKDLNAKGENSGWTEQMKKDFRDLTKQATAIDSAIIHNQQSMVKYGQVLKDLSGSKLKDLKSALREATTSLNKMSEKSPGREKLINDIKRIKEQIAGTSGLTMSFRQAQTQLKNLDNTPMDKLKQGLAAIKAQLDNPNIGNKWRRSLEQMQAQYQAAMAVRTAPTVSNKPVYTMNTAQLKAEQAALSSAFAATTGVKGYENQAANYAARLKEVNQQLKQMSEYEKMAADGARQLQATQEAAKVVQQVYRGQEVSLEKLNAAYQTLQARAQQFAGVNPAKAQAATRQMEMLRQRIQQVNSTMLSEKDIQDRIAHSGKYTVQQLQQAYNQLQAKLQTLHTNDIAAIKATQKQMKLLQQDINRATGQVSGFAKAWQTAKQNIMMYVGVFAIVNKIKTTISDLVTKNKELSDSMANIRKVSQWAYADVEKLTNNLAKIDTRNTINTLQNLAYQGAKLGIGQYGVEGLTGFVRAAEQVQTALGEDLGEEALPALAKLTEVMGLIPKFGVEEAMQKAGSAIYQLGATSTATGANIVEFSKRLMGLANVSGVTADQLLGLGSAADSMALMPEVAATAFNKLFNSIHGNTENIAKAVGIAKEELQDLLYEGRTMDALVKVFEKMQKMSMKELEGRGVFKELGSDGARLTNVMITMANKVDMLKSHLDVANQSFSEGRAVINEYMIQQETAAAYFERASNIWAKAFINPEGVDIVKQLAQEWYNVSYEMTHSASTMSSIKLTLESLATVVRMLITYLPTLIQLMMAYGVGSALQGIYLQYKAIYSAATLAGTATARFNALLKTNAMALAITAALMLAAKLYEVAEASKAAAAEEEKRQRIFTDAAAEALSVYNEQVKALDKYREALKKSNVSEEERNEIIRQFKQEFGSYLEKLGIEINTYKDMENALHRVNKELKDKAYYETGQKLRESYVGDAKSAQTNALSQFMQAAQKYDLPTKLMEDIVEGKVKTVDEAMKRVSDYQMSKLPAGTKVFDATKFGMGGWQDVREEENKGFGAKVSDFLFGNKTPKATKETEDIYHAINNLVTATQEVNTRENQVTQFMDQYAENYSPQISVDGAILNLKRLKELNEEKLNEGLNVLRDKWKEMSENDRKTDEGKQIGSAIDQYSKQIRAMRGEGYTPPPTKKEIAAANAAARKKENEAKQALRKELQDAKADSDAVISKIEEWYRLQETVITDMQADGKLTKEQAEQVVRTLNIAKNTALRDARLAISGRDTKAWEQTKQQIGDLMLDQGKWSQELLEQILGVSMENIRANLAKIDKGGGKYGITTSSLKDAVDKNAAGNQREIARLMARAQQEVEKIFMEYDFFEQAMRGFSNRLAQMGILSETARNMAERLTDANDVNTMFSMKDYDALLKGNEGAKQQMLQAFIASGAQPYGVNPEDKEQLRAWFMEFVGEFVNKGGVSPLGEGVPNVEYQYQSWAKPFEADFDLWLRDSDKYLASIQSFYLSLMKSEEDYYEKRKQSYNHYKKQLEQQDQAAGIPTQREDKEKRLQTKSQMQDEGIGASFWRQQGLGGILNDPEVMLIQQRIQWRNEDLESAKALLAGKEALWQQEKAQRLAAGEDEASIEADLSQRRMGFEDIIKERQTAVFDQQLSLTTKIAQEMRKRVQTVNSLTKPIQDGAENIGKKFGEMLRGVEEDSMTWNEIWRSMAQAVGDSIVDMMAQYAQNMIMEKMMNQQSKSEALSKAQVDVAAGTASAAAKTVGTLGWWGLALIPVIAAVLHGLLAAAFASDKKNDTSKSSATKIKLASGMLTYDEGNVGTYLGQDGRVYRAREDAAPKTGLITKPIATTVQGQPAIVAERGPEIVIGRRTTRRIQMAAPELLHAIQLIDRGYTPRRLYDEGTPLPATVPAASPAGQQSDQDTQMQQTLAALTQTVAVLSATVTQLQQKGIPAHINKYGAGGLIDEVKSGLRFDARYNK